MKRLKISNEAKGKLYFKRYTSFACIFSMAFLMTLLSSSISMRPSSSLAAEFVASVTNTSGYSLSVSSRSRVVTSVSATPEGQVSVTKDTINVKSDLPAGYRVYLGMAAPASSPIAGNSLYAGGNSSAAFYIGPTSGTYSEPAALNSNTWGYALAGVGNFDETYSTDAPNSTAKFAAVPLKGREQLIASAAVPSGLSGNDVDIFYGVNVNSSLPSGKYSNTIAYTALANAISEDSSTLSISPNTTDKINGGETVRIATGLLANASGVGDVRVRIGGMDCTSPSVSNSESGVVIITCIAPDLGYTGVYDVSVEIPTYSKVYFLAGGMEYKNKLTMWDIAYMQEMTSVICENTPTPSSYVTEWNGFNADTSAGLNYQDTVASGLYSASSFYDAAAGYTDGYLKVPETTLIDRRDNKTYLIRKLADGNCWMSQNLELDILGRDQDYATAETFIDTNGDGVRDTYTGEKVASDFVLTSEDTDLSSKPCWSANEALCPGMSDNSIFATQKTYNDAKYTWDYDALDGARSINVEATFPQSAYIVRLDGLNDNGSYKYGRSTEGKAYERSGNKYNYAATSAGFKDFNSDVINITMENSICSKNWRLPKEPNGDFNSLMAAYKIAMGSNIESANRAKSYPMNFTPSGFYNRGDTLENRAKFLEMDLQAGLYGNRLTRYPSTTSGARYAHDIMIYAAKISTGAFHPGIGYAIRCIAR